MGEIRFVGTGETRGYPYLVCKKIDVELYRKKSEYAQTILFDIRGYFEITVFEITRVFCNFRKH